MLTVGKLYDYLIENDCDIFNTDKDIGITLCIHYMDGTQGTYASRLDGWGLTHATDTMAIDNDSDIIYLYGIDYGYVYNTSTCCNTDISNAINLKNMYNRAFTKYGKSIYMLPIVFRREVKPRDYESLQMTGIGYYEISGCEYDYNLNTLNLILQDIPKEEHIMYYHNSTENLRLTSDYNI